MDGLREIDGRRFPLQTIDDVVGLFEDQLNVEPNLALLSIVLGIVEHSLTINKPLDKRPRGRPNESNINFEEADHSFYSNLNRDIPVVELEDVRVLFELFVKLIRANVDLSLFEHRKYTSTGLLKKVSDVLWNALTRTFYKDKGHLQFLYTLFNEQKMDCIGMAFGVLAGCQVLGLHDVHLAVTEDHVWAIYGRNGCLTSEITWHGKGTEDRRGSPVTITAPEKSWLYQPPMICNRYTEVATIVTGINPVINSTCESFEMAIIQKRVLWHLYDLGHLDKYPLALGVLADLEEIHPTTEKKRPSAFNLYKQAIQIAERHYNNSYIYPHTYLGNYYYRRRRCKEALKSWADAAQVASMFNYNREDDEIYREFNEIANEIMPNIIKTCCAIQEGLSSNNPPLKYTQSLLQESGTTGQTNSRTRLSKISDINSVKAPLGGSKSRKQDNAALLVDSGCYADVLRFFDGICEWEEGSSMPVLHIIWAKNMSYTVSKFFPIARTSLKIYLNNENNYDKQWKGGNPDKTANIPSEKVSKKKYKPKDSSESVTETKDTVQKPSDAKSTNEEAVNFSREDAKPSEEMEQIDMDDMDREGSDNNNTDIIIAQISLEPQDMEGELNEYEGLKTDLKDSNEVGSECNRNLVETSKVDPVTPKCEEIGNNLTKQGSDKAEKKVSKSPENGQQKSPSEVEEKRDQDQQNDQQSGEKEVTLMLRSQKMASMKDLLVCERLNLSAIKLLLTAQSQVNSKPTQLPSARGGPDGNTPNQPLRKRARNE